MSSYAQITLKSGRDKSVRQRHPRLFASALKDFDGKPKDGDVVDIADNKGEWLARGIINQQAQIAVRLLTWNEQEAIDEAFWQRRVAASIARRTRDPMLAHTDARRLIFGESDGLPGVIADDYAGHIVLELSTLAALRTMPLLMDALQRELSPSTIVLRGDEERLKNEFGGSLPKWVHESLANSAAPETVSIHENGLRFHVNLASGQKTGFYLDQRENRARVAAYAKDASVLNMFAFSGPFAVHALAAGATHVVNVDSSAEALALAEQNMSLNALSGKADYVVDDAFDDLRERRKNGERYDVVILDPPKFAHNPGQIERASRAYKDLNRLGLLLVKPGGILATFSCSGVIDATLLQKIAFSASIEAGCSAQVIERLSQASDHPVLLSFPESEYLKGLVLRVDG